MLRRLLKGMALLWLGCAALTCALTMSQNLRCEEIDWSQPWRAAVGIPVVLILWPPILYEAFRYGVDCPRIKVLEDRF